MSHKHKTMLAAGLLAILLMGLCGVLMARWGLEQDRRMAGEQQEALEIHPPVEETERPIVTIAPTKRPQPARSKPIIDTELMLIVDTPEPEPDRNERYAEITMTDSEMDELAACVFLEAGAESLDGQQAVVEVVFNRVLSASFPNSVHAVLHEGEYSSLPQFSTVYLLSSTVGGPEQYDAINRALYEDPILDVDVVFFSRVAENSQVWGRIGGHVFCRAYSWG